MTYYSVSMSPILLSVDSFDVLIILLFSVLLTKDRNIGKI